jgi:hypothetical protein
MPTATFAPSRHAARWCGGSRHRRIASVLAAERGAGYDVSRAPFGLPVLAELPELAAVLEDLTAADDRLLAAVAGLADLLRSDTVETTTGVGVEHWLAAVATVTRMDRRLLLQACRLLHRLPTLDAAVRQRRVSFAQLRGLTLALRSTSPELDAPLDRLLGSLLDGLATLDRPDPDVLVRQVADAVDELDPPTSPTVNETPPLAGTWPSSHGSTVRAGASTATSTHRASPSSTQRRHRRPNCSTSRAGTAPLARTRSSLVWPAPAPTTTSEPTSLVATSATSTGATTTRVTTTTTT